jgi:hypothetical protein
MHGQEEKHPEHVRDRPRGSRQVHPHGLPGGEGGNHRRRQGRRDQGHRHKEGRAGEMHHHQVHVSGYFCLLSPYQVSLKLIFRPNL